MMKDFRATPNAQKRRRFGRRRRRPRLGDRVRIVRPLRARQGMSYARFQQRLSGRVDDTMIVS
jgi:hypothetical protein